MWRKVVTPRPAEQPVAQAFPQPAPQLAQRAIRPTQQEALIQQEALAQQEALTQLLLPRPRRTLSLVARLSFWARTSRGSTTKAACFFQHVSATTWLRAS